MPLLLTVQNCALPIEDTQLRGLTDGQVNNLFWDMSTTSPALTFDIERSADGNTFQSIGSLSHGNTAGDRIDFNFIDQSPLPLDNFYRLRYIGQNGELTHSNTIRLRLTDPLSAFSLTPNPARGPVRYEFSSREASKAEVEIVDMYGRTVYRQNGTTQSGLNSWSLNLSELAPGPYTFRARQGSTGSVQHISKVVLQH
ncbi:MAG: T9SS type A sorting domain-containing protein [Bacteroidia bacterium]